jgi:hypothetical protein
MQQGDLARTTNAVPNLGTAEYPMPIVVVDANRDMALAAALQLDDNTYLLITVYIYSC